MPAPQKNARPLPEEGNKTASGAKDEPAAPRTAAPQPEKTDKISNNAKEAPFPLKTACLLLHGFAGSPFEMEPLIPNLKALGCTISLPALPGHDSSIADFRRTFFPDWLAAAEEHFRNLLATHDLVIPIGFSMGGSLALLLAARHATAPQLGGVIALAPAHKAYRFFPFRRRSSWLALTPLLRFIRPEIPLPGPSEASRTIAPYRGYTTPLCLPQLYSLSQGLRTMRDELPKITCPVRLITEAHDRYCPPEGVLSIARAVSSDDVTLRMVRMREHITGHHMLTTHRDTRERVAVKVTRFIDKLINARVSRL